MFKPLVVADVLIVEVPSTGFSVNVNVTVSLVEDWLLNAQSSMI